MTLLHLGPSGRQIRPRGRRSRKNRWTDRLERLKSESGASYREMANAADADVKTVRKWCGQLLGMKTLPEADRLKDLLHFLFTRIKRDPNEELTEAEERYLEVDIEADVQMTLAKILQDYGLLDQQSVLAVDTAWITRRFEAYSGQQASFSVERAPQGEARDEENAGRAYGEPGFLQTGPTKEPRS